MHWPATFRHTARRLAAGLVCAWLLGLPAHAATPDYALWDEVLLHNVRNGYVDYDGIRADPKFETFIGQLADDPGAFPSPAAELAYLVNAYNALAVRGILEGYSPATRFGRFRYFKTVRHDLAGGKITLEKLEHERIRTKGDPRIHFAIVCASISCPRLLNHAYLPETLDAQLDEAARGFVNDATRNRFDIAQRTAFVSQIFEWFRADFEAVTGSVPAYLARYAEEPAARAALREGRLALRSLPYDWELNGRYAGGESH
jgi:hypothetical protein